MRGKKREEEEENGRKMGGKYIMICISNFTHWWLYFFFFPLPIVLYFAFCLFFLFYLNAEENNQITNFCKEDKFK